MNEEEATYLEILKMIDECTERGQFNSNYFEKPFKEWLRKRNNLSEFNRGRRDILTAITFMGHDFEGAFILKKSFIDELVKQVKE